LLEDKDERFKNLFGKTALFVLLAVLGMGLALVWTGIQNDAFTAKSTVRFVADSGQDLSVGMPVKFSGFKIGKLDTLALDKQGRVQAEARIDSKYLGLIRQDAVMTLKKEGVIGDGVLEISRGGEDKPALAAGGNVRFERASGLEQAIVDVRDRIMPILDDLHQTLHDPDGDVRQTLKNLREFTAGMRGTRERLDRVLGSLDTNLNKEAVPLLQSLRKSAANAETLSGKLDDELPVLLNKADTTMENLRQASKTLNDAVQSAVPQLPGTISEVRATLGKTQKLIGDTQEAVDTLNTHWPLKSDVPVDTTPVKMDSHD